MDDVPSRAWFFFSPSGRLSRGPYALGLVFWFSLQFASVAMMFAGESHHSDGLLVLGVLLLMGAGLLGVVSSAMLTIKRVHDLGHPGIVAFLIFVPVVSFFALLFFLLFPSGPPNSYGTVPNRPQ